MDVRLSAEQQALRDTAAQVVDRLGPHAVGELDDPERAAKLDAAVAGAGWRELRTPTDEGGPLASAVEVALVAEELARGLADAAFLGPTLAAELRRLAGAPPASSPETVALTPDLAGFAGTADGAVAVDAQGAVAALLLVPDWDGYALARVDLPADAATVQGDLTRPVAVLGAGRGTGHGAIPLAEQTRPIADEAVTALTALALAVTCGDLVGTMRGAVQLARDHAADRQQFGAAIGSFQAVQHMLADALVATEGSRSVALHAAWAADALAPDDALGAAAAAKAYCARAARQVCEIAIQVHGGIGNTWECLAHVHLRRALLATDVLGGVGTSLARVLAHRGIVEPAGSSTEGSPG
jgi:alkylation response protein AidB-like acyl-CoA dehydrogenase